MSLETDITDTIRYMDTLYGDVSQVLRALDACLEEAGFISLWSPCYFNGSKAVYQPACWIPKTFTRNYVRESERKLYRLMLFFNIYLSVPSVGRPVAAWGWAMKKPDVDYWPTWNKHVISPSGPGIPLDGGAGFHQVVPASSSAQSRIRAEVGGPLAECFEFLEITTSPLVLLNTEVELKAIAVDPLLARISEAEFAGSCTGPELAA